MAKDHIGYVDYVQEAHPLSKGPLSPFPKHLPDACPRLLPRALKVHNMFKLRI